MRAATIGRSRSCRRTLQQLFQTYDWPGNIRELENMIKRIVILQDEELAVREISRSPRHAVAFAGVGAGPEVPDIAIGDNPSISSSTPRRAQTRTRNLSCWCRS